MLGRPNECAAAMQEKQPSTPCSLCASHLLNLTVMTMTNVQEVGNMRYVMKQLCLFLRGSPKRHIALKMAIRELDDPAITYKKKLVNLCPTQ